MPAVWKYPGLTIRPAALSVSGLYSRPSGMASQPMLGRSPIGTWIVKAADSTPGTASDALQNLDRRTAARAGGATRPAGSTRIAIAPRGLKPGSTLKSFVRLRNSSPPATVRTTTMATCVASASRCTDTPRRSVVIPGMRAQPVHEVSLSQVQQGDAAKDEGDSRAEDGGKCNRRPSDLQLANPRKREPRHARGAPRWPRRQARRRRSRRQPTSTALSTVI